ncbi:MAG: peptidoglycan recognition family protein [Candidatus Edwardsbacteria bacterium]
MQNAKCKIITGIIFLYFCFQKVNAQSIPFDFDKVFRAPFEGIVIHHTGTSKNITVEQLSNIHKWRIYKPVFDAMQDTVGDKIYSNHFYEGKETFCAYHWLVYSDGRKIQVLKDIIKIGDKWYIDNVGWHAGTWEMNGKTMAIAIVGNYRNSIPPKEVLNSVAEIIVSYQKMVETKLNIYGHREVRPTPTACPGNKFLGEEGWKNILIKTVEEKIEREK